MNRVTIFLAGISLFVFHVSCVAAGTINYVGSSGYHRADSESLTASDLSEAYGNSEYVAAEVLDATSDVFDEEDGSVDGGTATAGISGIPGQASAQAQWEFTVDDGLTGSTGTVTVDLDIDCITGGAVNNESQTALITGVLEDVTASTVLYTASQDLIAANGGDNEDSAAFTLHKGHTYRFHYAVLTEEYDYVGGGNVSLSFTLTPE